MFLIDDLLLSPFKGLLWIFKEVQEAAQQELDNEADAIKTALAELYMQLDTGQISEEEFTAEEKRLLDRLEAIEEADNEELENDEDRE
ncbi:MAG: gas vesicle protein GvpG [Nitrosomonas sp.]|nr:gas vesicle protein GvpG [Nitrosomonas sp.]MDP1950200.1 gas vesicle protein GvpG [Nitrosomonas sp.]